MKGYDSICCFRSRDDSLGKRVCWEITTDCNLRCPFCHRFDFVPEYYCIKNIAQTIRLLKQNQVTNVILSGGEPLLHPHFFELLDTLHAEGFDLDVCTNGTLLNDDIIARLKTRLSELSISIDAYDAARHDRMRSVPGCFDQTINNLRKLVAQGFDVHVTTIVDPSFASQIGQMTDFLYHHQIKSVAYLGLIPIETGVNRLFTPECQAELESQIDRVREEYPDMSINTKQLLVARSSCHCEAGRIVFGLGVDGLTLHPCLLTRKRPGRQYGETAGMCPGSRYLTQRKENNLC